MPGSKRQRELAHRRAERQAIRRREAAARRRKQRFIVGGSGLAVLALLLTVFFVFQGNDDDKTPEASPTESTSPSEEPSATAAPKAVACGATRPADITPQEFPKPAMSIDATKKHVATIKTSCGEVVVELLADKAPETINSFSFLASKKYFDGTRCHRMLTGADSVLQCGDPTATGSGGPGYDIKDENLPATEEQTFTYPAGTVAMANGGPNTGGSQFFFVIKDSPFPPDYAVFGKVTKGQDVLDKLLALGTEPGSQIPAPAEDIYIESYSITAT